VQIEISRKRPSRLEGFGVARRHVWHGFSQRPGRFAAHQGRGSLPRQDDQMMKPESLTSIPGVGPRISLLLNDIGIHRVSDLKGKNPEHLYQRLIKTKGQHVDRCVLYTFRCAVYYASNRNPAPSRLKWWNWKD
jgi:hypothetical protein